MELFAGAFRKIVVFAEIKHFDHGFFMNEAGDVVKRGAVCGAELAGVRIQQVKRNDVPADLLQYLMHRAAFHEMGPGSAGFGKQGRDKTVVDGPAGGVHGDHLARF